MKNILWVGVILSLLIVGCGEPVKVLKKGEQGYIQQEITSCDNDKVNSCMNIGMLYYEGINGQKNHPEAKKFFTQACDKNNFGGCYMLALMLTEGIGVEKDYDRALTLFEKSCDNNIYEGCSSLGMKYLKKAEVSDTSTAEGWYKASEVLFNKACIGGDNGACTMLGVMNKDGKGMEKNYTKAMPLFTKACNQGDYAACTAIGMMHRDGQGVPKNDILAKQFFERACNAGYANGCKWLNYMK